MRGFLCLVAAGFSSALSAGAEEVQLDCTSLFNARPVTVLVDGQVVPWRIGIDGSGKADGFATVSAARAHGDPGSHALPDDGRFAANADHPLVRLPYGSRRVDAGQARAMIGASGWQLPLSSVRLRALYLFFTSAEGASDISLQLDYSDGSSSTVGVQIPDYYHAPDLSNRTLFALASDLAKWNAAGLLAETDHHYIYGWRVSTDVSRTLMRLTLRKGAEGYLVFWGATGETKDR